MSDIKTKLKLIDTNDIFNIQTEAEFQEMALKIFRQQFERNKVYRSYCDLLYVNPSDVNSLQQIPFLPIDFFKTHRVLSSDERVHKTFESSGTTGQQSSKHHVTNLDLYRQSFTLGFKHFYGSPEDYIILGLLPAYLERKNSSLVYMVQQLIEQSGHAQSGFYLNNLEELHDLLSELESKKQKTLLIGVSFALLDFSEAYKMDLKHTVIMETGGMKGRREELIREDLHQRLTNNLGVDRIHSEYGMTELFSQAYSKGDGLFETPPWMKVLIRDTEDALTFLPVGQTGGINVIDLANINSCSFIETQDLGKYLGNDVFEVLGRFDHSDIRGCNLMAI